MNSIKKFFGIVWVIVAVASVFFLVQTAMDQISKKGTLDAYIQWGVFLFVYIPILSGLVVFGYFALKGEYDHIPISSKEIED